MSSRSRLVRAAAGLAVLLVACSTSSGAPGANTAEVSAGADPVTGRELFTNSCSSCHGPAGDGTDKGPSFLSAIYLPNHHADESFQRAVSLGVQPHHWDFGPMPPVPGLTREQVADIVAYVRQLQREAGLIE